MAKPINPEVKVKQSHKGCAPKIRKLKERYPEMSATAIAKRVGCTPDNVYSVLKRFLGSHSVQDLREFQQNKADVYDSLQQRCVASITSAKIAKTSAAQLTTMVAILEDKSRLVRGQATGINVTVLMDVVEAIRSRQGQVARSIGDSNHE